MFPAQQPGKSDFDQTPSALSTIGKQKSEEKLLRASPSLSSERESLRAVEHQVQTLGPRQENETFPVAPSEPSCEPHSVNQEESSGLPSTKKPKKDQLWKPLLSAFRTFVRNMLASGLDYREILDNDNSISRKAKLVCIRVMASVGAPATLQDDPLSHYSLLYMFVHRTSPTVDDFFRPPRRLKSAMRPFKLIFCKIFRENSVKLRSLFFKSELIRHLWSSFCAEEVQFIQNYFTQLKS